MKIAFYITGHGFGHAFRSCEIISSLFRIDDSIQFNIRTSAPAWIFEDSLPANLTYDLDYVETDVGTVQKDALNIDEEETLRRFSGFWRNSDRLAEEEAERLRGINAIISDISPVAFKTASILGVPSVASGNFIWSDIYKDYIRERLEYASIIDDCQREYSKASLALRHPFYLGFSNFAKTVDIGLAVRKSSKDPELLKRRLNIPKDKKMVLIAFGGFKARRLPDEYDCKDMVVFKIDSARFPLGSPDISMPDLISAADVLIGKPGYGITGECIAAGKPFVYTDRGNFAEYQVFVKEMGKYLRNKFIPQSDLFEGRIVKAIEEVLSMPEPSGKLSCKGAYEAAGAILNFLKT